MKIYKIYIIKNNINEVVYVGKTSQELNERFNQHKNDNNYPTKRDYFNDIENGCKIEEVYRTELEWDIDEWEQYYIDEYSNTRSNWFNKVRATKMTQLDKRKTINKLKRNNNTLEGDFEIESGNLFD